MGLWQDFLHFITLRPMPLSDSWVRIEENCLLTDKNSPVNLNTVLFNPEKEELRKYISPGFLEKKFKEITDLLIFHCTEEARQSPGFMFLQDETSRIYGDITINWFAEGTGKRKGLFIKISDEIDETAELTLRKSIEHILSPLKGRPNIGFTLEYNIGAAHADWEPPEKFSTLTF